MIDVFAVIWLGVFPADPVQCLTDEDECFLYINIIEIPSPPEIEVTILPPIGLSNYDLDIPR